MNYSTNDAWSGKTSAHEPGDLGPESSAKPATLVTDVHNGSFLDPLSSASAWATSAEATPSMPRSQHRLQLASDLPTHTPRASHAKAAKPTETRQAEVFQDVDQILFRDDDVSTTRPTSRLHTQPNGRSSSPHGTEIAKANEDSQGDDDDDAFEYPGHRDLTFEPEIRLADVDPDEEAEAEEFHYPELARENERGSLPNAAVVKAEAHQSTSPLLTEDQNEILAAQAKRPQICTVSDGSFSGFAFIDFTRLHRLCSSGTLEALQQYFREITADPPHGAGVSAFFLANEPNPTSGLTPLHYAAKEGKLDVLKWLVEDVGALVEIEDREGEVSVSIEKQRTSARALEELTPWRRWPRRLLCTKLLWQAVSPS